MKALKKILSVLSGVAVLCGTGVTTVSANNNADTDFSVYAQAGHGDFLAHEADFPSPVRDSNLSDCSYYATRENQCYVAFRKKTDTTSVYLKVTSRNSKGLINVRVVAPAYDTKYNARALTGAWLNNTKCNYNVNGYTVTYPNWYDAFTNYTYNRNGYVKIINWPGEYLIWNTVKENGVNYCGLLVNTSDNRDNSWFKGCWSPDSTGSYTTLK